MRLVLGGLWVCFFAMSAGTAMATEYLCTMKRVSRDGFVDKAMLISIRGDDSVYVFDGPIAHLHNAPLQADVKMKAPEVFRLKWTLTGLPTSNAKRAGPVRYTAEFNRKKKTLRVRVVMTSADNSPNGSGVCVERKKK